MGFFDGLFKSVAAPLVSGVASIFGGAQQNSTAKDLAKSNNDVQIELANTAHQREVADLKAAGLNPILSAGGNGASSPTMQGYNPQNIIEPAVSSAVRTAQLKATLDNVNADTDSKRESAELARKQQHYTDKQTDLLDTQKVKMENETQSIIADYWLKDAQKNLTRANENSARANATMAQLDAAAQLDMGLIMKKLGAAGATGKALADTLKTLHSMSKP